MKIIRLEAENVKRLRAVEITPDGTVQVVTGRNAQGKSSILDSIYLALCGGKAARDIPVPIRDGEEDAHVTLDLGDIVVTRTWTRRKGTQLVVTAADGAKYPTPQTLLDQLVGKLSFDPLAFTRLKPAEQRQALLDLLGLDFTDADRERQKLYDERLETGRQAHAFGDLPKLPKDAPMDEQVSAPIMDRIKQAQQRAEAIRDHETTVDWWQRSAADCRRRAQEISDEIRRLQEQLTQAEDEAAEFEQTIAADAQKPTLPQPESLDDLQDELAGLEDANRQARTNREIRDKREQQKDLEKAYTTLTHQIEAIDQSKADALAATTMPVDGLGFDDLGVTFAGVPFTQASSAEQIKVSLAMAMALNPTLRVVRILDGSLLDTESRQIIAEMADKNDFQVWLETVQDSSPSAIVIEDGQVAA